MLKDIYHSTYDAVKRQDLKGFYFLQGFPLLGGLISIGGVFLSLEKMITKTANIAVQLFKHQDTTKTCRDLKDWGIIFLNEVANVSL